MPAPRHARPSSTRPVAAVGLGALVAAAVAVPLSAQAPPVPARTVMEPEADSVHILRVAKAGPVRLARPAAPGTVTVRPGDTLSAIAGRACGNPGDFYALAYNNNVANPDLIYAGQVLKVACQAAAQAIAGRYGLLGDSPPSAPVSYTSHASDAAEAPQQPAQGAVVTSVSGTFGCAALESLWDAAGGNPGEALIAAEIAMAESGGNPDAVSPTDDYGLWQVNASNGALATLSPSGSAHSAVILSDNGTDWSPWTTYTSGAYKGRC